MRNKLKPSFKEGRRIVKKAKEINKELQDCFDIQKEYEKKVLNVANTFLKIEAERYLQDLSVDELSKAKMGIRIQALKEAGIYNISQLSRIPESSIERIKGIGPKSSKSIRIAVNQICRSAYSNQKIKINPNFQNGINDELVKNLYCAQKYDNLSKRAKGIYYGNKDTIEKLISETAPTRNWLLWSLSRSNKQNISIQKLDILEQFINGEFGKNVDLVFSEKQRLLKIQHDEYWKDFRQNAASYYAALENIRFGKKGNVTGVKNAQQIAIQNGMAAELAIAISNVQLDLRGLTKQLRSYQKYGVQYVLKQGAVLLGDEMGLGKTPQAIASIVCLRNSGGKHFMVICPASVLINWCREIKEWCDIQYFKIHGTMANEELQKWLSDGGIAVTTYETLPKIGVPDNFTFSMLVVDEAHYVKNPNAGRTRNVLFFRQRTSRVLYMTGTPIENKVEEMCFLIGCLQPDIARQIAGSTSLASAPFFRQKVAPVYFRRTKEDVLDELPEKIENYEWVSLTNEEIKRYRQSVGKREFHVMRKISWVVNNPAHSSKGERLLELVHEAVCNNKKIIIFSFYLDTIKTVKRILDVKTFGPINGSISPSRRQAIIDDFSKNKGGAVLLSQIQAGGTGLNIQAASVIIFCEPQLKPSIENQAIGRAYRMGQVDTVMVYHLLCEKTVDERINELLKNKQELFDNFADISVSGDESLITNNEIENMVEEERIRWGTTA